MLRSDVCGSRGKGCGRPEHIPLGQAKNISKGFPDKIYKAGPETGCGIPEESGVAPPQEGEDARWPRGAQGHVFRETAQGAAGPGARKGRACERASAVASTPEA